jgi:hypothetical protein
MRSFWSVVVIVIATLATLSPRPVLAQGGVVGRAGREAAEWAVRKLGGTTARVGEDAISRRAESFAAQHGEDAMRRLVSAGDHAAMAEELCAQIGKRAPHAPRQLALRAAHGEDAALALNRHGALAEPLIAGLGRPAARALAALGPRQARRLAILADSGELARIGRTPELLAVLARFGDRAMAFVWDHKGALATSAVLAAFLNDPRLFLDGAKSLAGAVARPLTQVPGRVDAAVAQAIDWWIIAPCTAILLVFVAILRHRRLPAR